VRATIGLTSCWTRVRRLSWATLTVLVVLLVCGAALAEETETVEVYADPIVIEGNVQLQARAAQGTGTALSPYVIELLTVDVQSAPHCLVLRNLDAYFVVRRCTFTGASDAGVLLDNVQNGWFVECVIEGNGCGLACQDSVHNVVLSANTFRDNDMDVLDASCPIEWDDGTVGNYWERYAGVDANRDGIGDTPYSVSSQSDFGGLAVDRYPLLDPFPHGDDAGGSVLLYIDYTVGEAFDILHTVSSTFSLQFLFPVSSETWAEMRMRQRVLGAPGTGLFTIEETVVEDSGETTVNGSPEPYESSKGVVTVRRVHRLGTVSDPGYGAVTAEVAGVSMPAQFPARQVQVGDTWDASWTVDAQSLDIDEGEERFDAAFTLVRFEELHGQQCAVIEGRADIALEGRSFDPDLGVWIHLTGTGAIETTIHLSMVNHRIIRQSETIDIAIVASSLGMELFTQSVESNITSIEVPVGTERPQVIPESEDFAAANDAFERGMALLLEGEFGAAERAMLRAAELFAAVGETELEANALFGAGLAEMRQEKLEDALEVLERAAERFHTVSLTQDEAACYNSLGLCYRRLGEHKTALACYDRVLELCGDNIETKATAFLNIGVCLSTLGDYIQAIEMLQTAGRLKDLIPDPDGKIRVLVNLGPCYRKLGHFELALATYDQAISSCTAPSQRPFEATALMNRGACQMEMGNFEEAMQDLEASRELWHAIGDPCGEAGAWITTANCQRTMGDPVAAWSSLEHAAALCTRSDIRGSIDYSQAWCRIDFGDAAMALDLFESALGWANEGGDMESAWRCKRGLGKVYWISGQLSDAENWYVQAIADVEEVRSRVASEETRTAFFETIRTLYEEYLQLLLEMDHPEDTLPAAERCRARTFLDLVAAGPVDTLEDVAEEGIRTGVVEASAIEADLAEVVAGLPVDTAALEYFVTDDATYVWLVRDGVAGEPEEIGIDRRALRERVLAFRTTIETPTTGLMDVPDETVLTMSRDLYELLIAPAEEQLEDIEHLVIVPSGPLYYLPFCALIDCPGCEGPAYLDGEYLIERYSLSYAPSLTTLKYAWASSEGVQTDPLFLAVADPDAGDPVFRRLPEAQREAETVAGLFGPSEVYVGAEATEVVVAARAGEADQILLATHGWFNPVNPMFSYLLLSPTEESDGRLYTHEIFGLDLHTDLVTLSACETLLPALEDAEEQVLVVLQGEDEEEEEDVELTQELLETLTAGDEIVGLTRALLYAGTPTVVSTLWRVVSETTEPLMVAFYGYLQHGLDKADALRQAQMDVMVMYPHPRYWAAFELVGDWR